MKPSNSPESGGEPSDKIDARRLPAESENWRPSKPLDFFRLERMRRGVSQETIGKAMGRSAACYARIERGEQPMTPEALMAACSVLNLDPLEWGPKLGVKDAGTLETFIRAYQADASKTRQALERTLRELGKEEKSE